MNPPKHNLVGLSLSQLTDLAVSFGEPRYRGKQLFQWLYARGATSFSGMTDLAKEFRDFLESVATIEGISIAAKQESALDGTTKYLFALHDGLRVESVLIPPSTAFRGREARGDEEQKRLTLCVSTQVGCPLDCAFCATASMGYRRNLMAGEIVDQILQVGRDSRRRITNVVFMGMGEPMMNYDNVMSAVEILTAGPGIAARRITVSTAGWADRIRQMGDEKRRVKLAVSLHSAVDETRSALMPLNRKFNLETLGGAIAHYYRKTRQRVTYEYVFFDGINDTDPEVKALIRFARRVPCKINVIPFHTIGFTRPTGFSARLQPSPRMPEIVDHLRASNLTVMVRSNAGEDIDAACGQLAVRIMHGERRTHGRKSPGGSRAPGAVTRTSRWPLRERASHAKE